MEFKTKVEKKEKGIVVINVTMPFAEVKAREEKAYKYLSEKTEIEGFRKGNVPKDILIKKVGQEVFLQQCAEQAVNDAFPEILKKEQLQMIGYPAINITSLGEEKDLEFAIELTVYPEVKLPDYKTIAKNTEKTPVAEVTKEDLEKVEKNLLEMQNKMKHQEHQHKDGEKCDHKDDTALTDEFISKIGNFKTVDEFRKKAKEDIYIQKNNDIKLENREKIVENILKDTKVEVPEILINLELDKIIASTKETIKQHGLTWEQYLKSSKKDEMDIRKEFRDQAIKRAKLELILKEIFREEKLEIDKNKLEEQKKEILKMYPDQDEKNVELYLENILINEAVIEFLENLK